MLSLSAREPCWLGDVTAKSGPTESNSGFMSSVPQSTTNPVTLVIIFLRRYASPQLYMYIHYKIWQSFDLHLAYKLMNSTVFYH